MSEFKDPGKVSVKSPTRTSFANQARVNQGNHEARISALESIPDAPAVPSSPYIRTAAGRPSSAMVFVQGDYFIESGSWVDGARYISFTTGLFSATNSTKGTSQYYYDIKANTWTGSYVVYNRTSAKVYSEAVTAVTPGDLSGQRLIPLGHGGTTFRVYCITNPSTLSYEMRIYTPAWVAHNVSITAHTFPY